MDECHHDWERYGSEKPEGYGSFAVAFIRCRKCGDEAILNEMCRPDVERLLRT